MKVDSMEAKTYMPTFEKTSREAKVVNTPEKVEKPKGEFKKSTELESNAIQSLSSDDKILIEAIENANKKAQAENKSFSFSIHEGTKRITVKVLDETTDEVIKEFPPEKILDMVAKMWEFAGIFVDEKR